MSSATSVVSLLLYKQSTTCTSQSPSKTLFFYKSKLSLSIDVESFILIVMIAGIQGLDVWKRNDGVRRDTLAYCARAGKSH
jgi:hypothetical protein